MERWATFDCYGTLIDWNDGIRSALARLWPSADDGALLDAYHRIEPAVQAGSGAPYKEVLAITARRIAEELDLPLEPDAELAVPASLPSWPAFLEVPAALRALRDEGWRLAILSNTDPELLAASLLQIETPIDLTITVADSGSYKPASGHWDVFFAKTGIDRANHVHVAASLFHDIEPCARMGLRAVWINRLGETTDLATAAVLPDLSDLPATLRHLR